MVHRTDFRACLSPRPMVPVGSRPPPGLRPFGAETPHRGVSGTPLTQNWMRDYDPTTGRYIQADPLGLVDGASVYGYGLQSPGRFVDPRGEQSLGDPNGIVPGGPWKWSPDPGNSRGGGSWTNDRGGTTSWDRPGSHWDTHDHSGAQRDRYDRWGTRLDPSDPHGYERQRKPRVPPLGPRLLPYLLLPLFPCMYMPPNILGHPACEVPVACLEDGLMAFPEGRT